MYIFSDCIPVIGHSTFPLLVQVYIRLGGICVFFVFSHKFQNLVVVALSFESEKIAWVKMSFLDRTYYMIYIHG